MSRPITSMPSRSRGSSITCRVIRARSSRLPTIDTFSTTSRVGFWNWIAARAFRGKGNYTSWLEQKQERLRRQEKSESERQKTLQRELEWIRMSPKARHAKGKARINCV